jgi:hypothetical protein
MKELTHLLDNFPNDFDLGSELRSLYYHNIDDITNGKYQILKNMVYKFPNDAKLGEEFRELINLIIKS